MISDDLASWPLPHLPGWPANHYEDGAHRVVLVNTGLARTVLWCSTRKVFFEYEHIMRPAVAMTFWRYIGQMTLAPQPAAEAPPAP